MSWQTRAHQVFSTLLSTSAISPAVTFFLPLTCAPGEVLLDSLSQSCASAAGELSNTSTFPAYMQEGAVNWNSFHKKCSKFMFYCRCVVSCCGHKHHSVGYTRGIFDSADTHVCIFGMPRFSPVSDVMATGSLWAWRFGCGLTDVLAVRGSCLTAPFSSQVMPILDILYHVEDRNSHHVYMALIILLILTEDDTFNRSIHEVVSMCVLQKLFWFNLILPVVDENM